MSIALSTVPNNVVTSIFVVPGVVALLESELNGLDKNDNVGVLSKDDCVISFTLLRTTGSKYIVCRRPKTRRNLLGEKRYGMVSHLTYEAKDRKHRDIICQHSHPEENFINIM